MTTKTKIICTMGPSVNSYDKITELIHAGMNVARLNFSHGTHEEHEVTIKMLKRAREELRVPLAIMLDTRGPEVRIGRIKNNEVMLQKGQHWLLVDKEIDGDADKVFINPGYVLECFVPGVQVLFNDGYISSTVIEKTSQGVLVEIENGGLISSRKGVNVPNISLNLPAITDKDIEDIHFGCEQDVDFIAASFIRSPQNIVTIKNILAEKKKSDIKVIAKIENHEGVENFDGIIQVADGVMIARGDLGVEVPLSRVPRLQKEMIRKSYFSGKPSVTATQILESMIVNPRPTRAEVSDVANAVYDSTSAVMLSGETAVGKYPVETVRVMKSIVKEAEEDFDYNGFFDRHSRIIYNDVPSSVTLATVKTAYTSSAKAIFAFTSRGSTARLLSRLRPGMPIVAMTPNLKTYHQMALNWGVYPYMNDSVHTIEEAFEKVSEHALERGVVSYGDLVVVTAGAPFGISGTTNMMMVENIGEVLVRGHVGLGPRVHGNIAIVLSPETVESFFVRDQLVVIPFWDDRFIPLIRESLGVILQNNIDDSNSERHLMEFAEKTGKSVLVRADAALAYLKAGQLVTLDPEKALVYKGVVL